MIPVKDEGKILERTDFEFERSAVFNPACVEKDGVVHMFYRAVDSRNVSSIGYCQLVDNKVIKRLDHPVLFPEYPYETKGVEDPRIIYLEGTYYLFYTAYDEQNALVAYATSSDLTSFTKKGVISPRMSYDIAEDLFRHSGVLEKYLLFETYYKEKKGEDVLLWEKDSCLFPKKINGKFALLHRVLPGIQIVYFSDFTELTEEFWKNYLKELGKHIVMDPENTFESRNIGLGCPPVETSEGWLLIYHGVQDTREGTVYSASAALFDLSNPQKVIGALKEPLFSPKESWERIGRVNNVVFPTCTTIKDGRLYIYYGAADTLIAAKSLNLTELLTVLKNG